MVNEEVIRNASSTEYVIEGGFEEVSRRVKELFTNYHPLGYGTVCTFLNIVDSGANYRAKVIRANSCD